MRGPAIFGRCRIGLHVQLGRHGRKARLEALLVRVSPGIHLVEHMAGDGATVFEHACKLGFEGIVSKSREHPYRSGPSKAWLKVKNLAAPGVLRFEDKE
jgi:ATP-dependent DNA ligase